MLIVAGWPRSGGVIRLGRGSSRPAACLPAQAAKAAATKRQTHGEGKKVCPSHIDLLVAICAPPPPPPPQSHRPAGGQGWLAASPLINDWSRPDRGLDRGFCIGSVLEKRRSSGR
jgi:hypothetical protein